MKKTQYDSLIVLLTRPNGCSAMEIIKGVGTVCPHKRISELRLNKGWTITKKQDGKYLRYFGKPPKAVQYKPCTVWVK